MSKEMFFGLLFVLVLLQASTTAFAQDTGWRTYSPLDRLFSVALPAPLRRVGAFNAEHGIVLDQVEDDSDSQIYAAIEGAPEDARFGIVVVKGTGQLVAQMKRSETIEYFGWLLFADEDELQFMRPSVKIRSNGLNGREYFYIKEPTINRTMFTRGRIFDTGHKIYFLFFLGRDAKDLTSPDAERFFKSFRVNQRKSKKRKAA